jgi:Flp pilus assembly protein TadG
MRMIRTAIRERGRCLRAQRHGTAAAEFAVVGGFLSLLVVGLADYSLPVWQQMQVGNAARAGAMYAAVHGFDNSAITNAAQNATSLSVSVTVPAATTCGCPNAATGIVAATCGTTCAGGTTAGTYITIATQMTYTPLLSYAGIGSSLTLRGTSIARIK